MINMHKVFFIVSAFLFQACGVDQKPGSTSQLMHGAPVYPITFELCNKENIEIFVAVAHLDPIFPSENLSNGFLRARMETHGWTKIPPGACPNIASDFQTGGFNAFWIISSDSYYIPSSSNFVQENAPTICARRNLSSSLTIQWNALAGKSGDIVPETCASRSDMIASPKGSVFLFTGTAIENGQDATSFSYKVELTGGKFQKFDRNAGKGRDRQDIIENIKKLQNELDTLKKKKIDCSSLSSEFRENKYKVLEVDPEDFFQKFTDCVDDSILAAAKSKVISIQLEVRSAVDQLVLKMDGILESARNAAKAIGIMPPYDDEFAKSGVSDLVESLSQTSNTDTAVSVSKAAAMFVSKFTSFIGVDHKSLFAALLAYSGSFGEYGKKLYEGPVSQDRVIDYIKSFEITEEFFDTLDLKTKEEGFGYDLDSPVAPEIQQLVNNIIKPFSPSDGMIIEEELKKWKGELSERQKGLLDALQVTAEVIPAIAGDSSSENARARLSSIISGAAEAIKTVAEAGACIGQSVALGDFVDWYEIIVGKDYCDGTDLNFAGRAATAAGLVIGSGKFWRIAANVAGLSTKKLGRIGHFVADILEGSRKKIPDLKESEVKEVLRDLDVSMGCKLLSSISRSSDRNILDFVFGVSTAYAESADEECLKAIFSEVVDNAGQYWSLAGYKHVIRGDLKEISGLTKIAGGLHTNKGLTDFLMRNKRQGFVYEVVDVASFAERNLDANKILVRKLPNGIREVQFPRGAFFNSDAAAISLPIKTGGKARHIKTLWPDSFTSSDIANAAKEAIAKAGENPKSTIFGELKGIPFTLYYKKGKIESIFPTFSGL